MGFARFARKISALRHLVALPPLHRADSLARKLSGAFILLRITLPLVACRIACLLGQGARGQDSAAALYARLLDTRSALLSQIDRQSAGIGSLFGPQPGFACSGRSASDAALIRLARLDTGWSMDCTPEGLPEARISAGLEITTHCAETYRKLLHPSGLVPAVAYTEQRIGPWQVLRAKSLDAGAMGFRHRHAGRLQRPS